MGVVYNNIMQQAVVANVGVDLLRPDKPAVRRDRENGLFQNSQIIGPKPTQESTRRAVLDLEFDDLFCGMFEADDAVQERSTNQVSTSVSDWAELLAEMANQDPEERAEIRAALAPEFYEAVETARSASPGLAALTVELLRDEPEFKRLMDGSSSEQKLQLCELKFMDMVINGNLDDREAWSRANENFAALVQSYYAQALSN